MLVDVGKFSHISTKVARSGWVRLIGQGWVIWLVGGCGYAYRSRDGCGLVWASLSIYGQTWAGLNGSD